MQRFYRACEEMFLSTLPAAPEFARRIVCPLQRCGVLRDRGLERALDSLHDAGVHVELVGNIADAFPGLESGKDSHFDLSGYPRSPKLLAFILGPPKPRADSLLDHRSLELGKDAKHLKHGLSVFPARSKISNDLVMRADETPLIFRISGSPARGAKSQILPNWPCCRFQLARRRPSNALLFATFCYFLLLFLLL
jgi:hypothetical protein